MKGWSVGTYKLTLMTLHMNSLGPKQIIFYLATWGQTMSQEALKFSIIDPQDFLALTPSLKQA
jgi:hypothetical protein